jgi:GTP-binding protein Era
MGIVNGEDFQIVYSDTPGIIEPNYKLHEYMMKYVNIAVEDADIILFVTDVKEQLDKSKRFTDILKNKETPLLVLVNKIDLSQQDKVEDLINHWKSVLPQATILPTSAKERFNLDRVFQWIIDSLPFSPPYFPKDQLTNRSERFFVAEIIREKILLHYRQEIPYATEVQVESFKEGASITKISATIFVMKRSQKGIIIGNNGQALKQIGTEARMDIEQFLERKVFLDIYVKVNKDWKYRDQNLRRFGYNR